MKKLLFFLLPFLANAASPYLPEPGQLQVNLNYTFDRYRNFKAGSVTTPLPGVLNQNSILPNLSYGVTRRLAADFDTSFTRASLPGVTLQAVVNTSYGVRYQAWRNERLTLTVRAAGIRSEFYPLDLSNVTNGVIVNGFHGSAQLGVVLPKRTFAILDAGYIAYAKPAHDRFVGSVFIGQSRGRWTYYTGYQDNRATAGIDIANAQSVAVRFAEQRRVIGMFNVGGGYTLPKSIYLGATYSRWVTARNAPESNSLAVTLGFRVRLRQAR